MRTLVTALASLALCALVVVPAGATHGGPHPTFRTENTWFHCTPGGSKIHQVDWVTSIGSATTGWNTTPPSQSVQEGAGCGGLDWGGTTNTVYSVAFRGTFTGNMRDLTVRIHSFLLDNARQTPTETLRLAADVDGVPLFPPGAQPNHGRTVTVTPERDNSGATDLYEFTITNLGYVDDEGVGHGLAYENGDGKAEHVLTLYLGVHGTALGQDPSGHKVNMWVWDTTEVPSGITFNPAVPAAAKVAADLPTF